MSKKKTFEEIMYIHEHLIQLDRKIKDLKQIANNILDEWGFITRWAFNEYYRGNLLTEEWLNYSDREYIKEINKEIEVLYPMK